MYCIVLYYIVLYCIVLCCIALYCIALHACAVQIQAGILQILHTVISVALACVEVKLLQGVIIDVRMHVKG